MAWCHDSIIQAITIELQTSLTQTNQNEALFCTRLHQIRAEDAYRHQEAHQSSFQFLPLLSPFGLWCWTHAFGTHDTACGQSFLLQKPLTIHQNRCNQHDRITFHTYPLLAGNTTATVDAPIQQAKITASSIHTRKNH